MSRQVLEYVLLPRYKTLHDSFSLFSSFAFSRLANPEVEHSNRAIRWTTIEKRILLLLFMLRSGEKKGREGGTGGGGPGEAISREKEAEREAGRES